MKPKGLCIVTKCQSVEEFIARFHAFCDETSLFVNTGGTREVGIESRFAVLLADKTPVLHGWCVVFDAWTDAANPFGRPGLRLGLHRLTPQSQAVFARLQAARAAALKSGAPLRRNTQPIELLSRAPTMTGMPTLRPKRPLTVQIPTLGDSARRPTTERPAPSPIPDLVLLDGPTERMAHPPAGAIAMGVAAPHPRLARSSAAPTAIFPEGSSETRTPGSALVLPANPLMNLTDESLEGFVDCRIYEETAPVDATGGPDDDRRGRSRCRVRGRCAAAADSSH
jgi:hypothetical protein